MHPTAGERPALEPETFARFRRSMRDPAFFSQLIDIFFAESEPLLKRMRAALNGQDAQALFRAAHTLKSNSAVFGAETLATLCRSLEEKGRAGHLDGAAAEVARVEVEYARVVEALERARSGPDTTAG